MKWMKIWIEINENLNWNEWKFELKLMKIWIEILKKFKYLLRNWIIECGVTTSTLKFSSSLLSLEILAGERSSSSKSNSDSLSSYSTFSSNSLKSGANADQFSTCAWDQSETTPLDTLAMIGLSGCH